MLIPCDLFAVVLGKILIVAFYWTCPKTLMCRWPMLFMEKATDY